MPEQSERYPLYLKCSNWTLEEKDLVGSDHPSGKNLEMGAYFFTAVLILKNSYE